MHARESSGLFALALISFGGPLLVLGGYDLASQYEDDAFYYFQIARNVGAGMGFTFDGVHPTNGFHPLWLAVLVPVFGLVADADLPVRIAGLIEAALVGGAAALIYRGLRAHLERAPALCGALLVFMPGARRIARTGLEGALTVFVVVAVWFAVLSRRSNPRARWLGAGVLCGVAVLARLETAALVIVIAVCEREHFLRRPRAAIELLLPPALCLSAYLSWNRLAFDAWLPVSGMVKSLAAAHVTLAPPSSSAPPWLLPLAVFLALGVWWRLRASSGPELWRATGLPILAATALAMLAADWIVVRVLHPWYFAPALPVLAVAAAVATSEWRRAASVASIALVLLALVRVPRTVWNVHRLEHEAHLRGEAADWLRAHEAPGTRVGTWNGGMLGYYSGLPIVMLDGLANSTDYYRRVLVGGDLAGYLDDEGIALLATTTCTLRPVLSRLSRAERRLVTERYLHDGPLSEAKDDPPCRRMTRWRRARP